MKIDNQIITNYDLEKEAKYLLALNPRLKEIDEKKLMDIAKRSLIKEKIRKNEIMKYKTLDKENAQIENVLNNLIANLNFENQEQLQEYLNKISDKNLYSYNVYQIEGEGKKLFSEIKGNVDTIMGLPVKNIKKYLENIK